MKHAYKRTPEEAVRLAIEALGGLQRVGHLLRGVDSDPIKAGEWLSHCLQTNDSNKRTNLTLSQIQYVLREATAAGHPEGAVLWAELTGLEAKPRNTEAELVAAVQHAQVVAQAAQEAAQAAQSLLEDNPELLARMRAAGLRVVS